MDSHNSHPRRVDQCTEQPPNLLGMVSPVNQGLGRHMDSLQQTVRLPFLTTLDQHRQQVDRVLQAHNQHVRVALQQQISSQNETLINFTESMARDVLVQKNEEVYHLGMELQNTQGVLRSALQERDEWLYLAKGLYEINQLLSLLPPMQATNAHAHGVSTELESAGSCNQALNMEMEGTAVGRTQTSLACKLCFGHDACMLILPCQHLCACKSCLINLTVCPICYSAKDDVIESRFD